MIDGLDEEPATVIAASTVTGHVDAPTNKETTPARRKKVRKGTRSCWECKRRKIRCIFASSENATCIGCQRRRAPCVSQDMPEDLAPARLGNRHLGERIGIVEDFMKNILASKDVASKCQFERDLRQDRYSNSDTLQTRSNDSAPSSVQAALTPSESSGESAPSSSLLILDPQGASGQAAAEIALHHLLAAFPTEADAKILLRESIIPIFYTELINTQPYSKLTRETLAAPYFTAELGASPHPVMLAKRMLFFAITLQGPLAENISGLSEPQSVLMRRLTTAATTWVTTREEMHGTVESLICIILEGVFEINAGNLRRAWVVFRRAMTAAQLMGLHRSPVPPVKRIDTSSDVKPEVLWFRIIYMDRYLSLLLGLPQGTSDKSMGAMSALRDEPPLGKFDRLLTVIACRILERNESAFAIGEIATTQSIDSELLTASRSMPASFWRPANFQNLTLGSPETLLETLRLGAQVYYYGLLIQLHLPYMMLMGQNTEHEYSKITCVDASRHIMARFIAHRAFNPRSNCSRRVDLFALLAAMTLLLAHIDAHHHREATNFLAHHRLSDRAMLDQALETMDTISNIHNDVMTGKGAELIRRLLAIEADAAEGRFYTARSVSGDDEVPEEEGEELRLHIPYLGVIKIARQGPASREPPHQTSHVEFLQRETVDATNDAYASIPRASCANASTFSSHLHDMSHGSVCSGNLPALEPILRCTSSSFDNISLQPHMESPSSTAAVDDWSLQGVDMAFFDSLTRGAGYMDPVELEQ